jgi:hypothetical protein
MSLAGGAVERVGGDLAQQPRRLQSRQGQGLAAFSPPAARMSDPRYRADQARRAVDT